MHGKSEQLLNGLPKSHIKEVINGSQWKAGHDGPFILAPGGKETNSAF